MSRIGKMPINIPQGVKIEVNDKNVVKVKGPKGELSQWIDPCITVKVDTNVVNVERHTEQKTHRAKHGLYRTLIANMITGVSQGYTKIMEVEGVGYKAQSKGQELELSLGYAHNIIFVLPDEVKVQTLTERGKSPTITLTSHDKQLLGQVAAKIRSLRKPEPYKGKGIKFKNEILRRKAGKTAAS